MTQRVMALPRDRRPWYPWRHTTGRGPYVDNVVVITATPPKESALVSSLREAGWRVIRRRPDDDPDEVALDRPDIVVVDVPGADSVKDRVEPVLDAPGMESVPVMAVVDLRAAYEAAAVRRLADFIVRPVRKEEVAARIGRPLRTGRDDDDRIKVGSLIVDIKGYEASLEGQAIDLTYQEFELLKFLASNPGQAFSRDQLLARVWGYDYYGGSRTVDIHVRRIRAKLGAYAACVKTIRHVGYKWAPIQEG